MSDRTRSKIPDRHLCDDDITKKQRKEICGITHLSDSALFLYHPQVIQCHSNHSNITNITSICSGRDIALYCCLPFPFPRYSILQLVLSTFSKFNYSPFSPFRLFCTDQRAVKSTPKHVFSDTYILPKQFLWIHFNKSLLKLFFKITVTEKS
jgi:hypothetical protein